MLKIQKSRVAKYAFPGNYTFPTHTGKSGYVSTQPKGRAPFPFSWIEEISSNVYPSARKYVPPILHPYTDSYYDLRNEQYKYWYNKWGKPFINKRIIYNANEALRYQKALYKKKTSRQQRNAYPKFHVCYDKYGNRKPYCDTKPKYLRRRKRFVKYRSSGQRPYGKRRSSYGRSRYRLYY